MKKYLISSILIIFVSILFLPFGSVNAQSGATLFLSPGSGTYGINKSFSVKVSVNSGGGIGINAAEGALKYDPNYLMVTNISESGSIFKLWTSDPSYSNTAGTITFGGGSPGSYTGSAGTIFTVTFSTKKTGTAKVTFTSGSVLAADGKGTNVFSGFGNGEYTINEAEKKEEVTRPDQVEKKDDGPKGILPPTPEVTSGTHPEEDNWYSNNQPEFSWKILADLSGVSFLISEEIDEDPGNQSDGIIESERFGPIEDGEWYFHIKYQNRYGWGQPSHNKFLVDVTPPEPFTVTLDNGSDTTNPTPKLRFTTTDASSGLDHFDIFINQEKTVVSPSEVDKGYFQTFPLLPNDYAVTVVAFDNAGNGATSTIKFAVDPLRAPIITKLPTPHNKKDDLVIQGTSFYPQVTIKLYIAKSENEVQEYIITTDDQGNWSYFHEGDIDKGNYEVWAKVIDERGAQSLSSAKELLVVVAPSILDLYCLWIIIFLILLVIGLLIYVIYQDNKFTHEKIRIKRETEEVKNKLRKIFAALREEVDELIELADKRPGLSESERRVKEKLQESLDISEEFIGKEVEDVEKEIKISEKKLNKNL